MALLELRVTITAGGFREAGDGSYEYEYIHRADVFNTETRQVQTTESTYWEPAGYVPTADYYRPSTEEFFWGCVENTTTRRGYFHDGQGGLTTVDTPNAEVCGYVPPVDPEEPEEPAEPPVIIYGCTDPDATNYDPNATHDNGSCIIPERMQATLPAALAVAGSPIVVALQSGPTGKVPARAVAVLTLGELGWDTALTINGVPFRFSLTPQVGEFYDTETLAQALLDEGSISDRYTITQTGAQVLELQAIMPGSAYTPQVSIEGEAITAVITPGVDEFRSQTKQDWGCYVELWGCSGSYGAEVDRAAATLLERTERLYAPGNSYRFDVSAALRLHTGHALFTQADRLKSYFVRYGEVFVPQGQTQRRRHPVGESPALWALEGTLPLHQLNDLPAPLLLNRLDFRAPLPLHGTFYAEALFVLAASGTRLLVEATFRYFDGSAVTETLADTTPLTGGVQRLTLQPVLARAFQLQNAKQLLQVEVTLKATLGTATTLLGTRMYEVADLLSRHRCLVFATSLGAYETCWLLAGDRRPKRQAQTYLGGVPGGATTSSRSSGTRKVELQQTQRYHSPLLNRAAFEALSLELGASPDVFLYEPQTGTYTAVTVADMEASESTEEETYYISLDLQPGLPHNPLTN